MRTRVNNLDCEDLSNSMLALLVGFNMLSFPDSRVCVVCEAIGRNFT